MTIMAPEFSYSGPGSLSMIPMVGTCRFYGTVLWRCLPWSALLFTLFESSWEASIYT